MSAQNAVFVSKVPLYGVIEVAEWRGMLPGFFKGFAATGYVAAGELVQRNSAVFRAITGQPCEWTSLFAQRMRSEATGAANTENHMYSASPAEVFDQSLQVYGRTALTRCVLQPCALFSWAGWQHSQRRLLHGLFEVVRLCI